MKEHPNYFVESQVFHTSTKNHPKYWRSFWGVDYSDEFLNYLEELGTQEAARNPCGSTETFESWDQNQNANNFLIWLGNEHVYLQGTKTTATQFAWPFEVQHHLFKVQKDCHSDIALMWKYVWFRGLPCNIL